MPGPGRPGRADAQQMMLHLEIEVDDPSNFYQRLLVDVVQEENRYIIKVARCVSVAHAIAAIALEMSRESKPPGLHFGWSAGNMQDIGKTIADHLKSYATSWAGYSAFGSFLLYLLGYLVTRFELTMLGVARNLEQVEMIRPATQLIRYQ